MHSKAIIVGKPNNFDLKRSLKSAQFVRIAMAFATRSGWNFIREELSTDGPVVDIVVGLSGWITEPRLLQEWYDLSIKRLRGFRVSVSPMRPIFHPKVVLVTEESGSKFAIVGSGNLTQGGQQENVECGAYICDEQAIAELEIWFAELSRLVLKKEIIESYRKDHNEARRLRARQALSKSGVQTQLKGAQTTDNWKSPHWDELRFMNDFKKFMKSADAIAGLESRVERAKAIRKALRMPRFNFDKSDWQEFYAIREFGAIRLTYQDIPNEMTKLRGMFRALIVKPLELETLESAFAIDGKRHIRGVGTNLISKVLTVHDRHWWPLFNRRVIATFGHYGYKAHWGAESYLRFAQDIRNCLASTDEVDFWALDVFCEYKSR
ncbi:MAG: phospholipase D-like domain-containing protein [Acidobacteriaceae bacterium]